MVNIALLGHGVVGSGVVEVLTQNCESITKRAKERIEIKYILDKREFNDSKFAEKFTKNYSDILNDDDVKIVVEVMGGLSPAYEYVKEALLKGKSVVTSNKELVAEKGHDLLKIANEKNCNFLFEASVGGGIPIILPIHQCLAANEVIEIAGILNGTTNFILTKMIHDNVSFNEALKMAQELGYAERDPSADIDGDDACRKICILASLAYGKHVYPENVHVVGIRDIDIKDVKYVKECDCVIKLIGRVKKLNDGKLEIEVEPMLVSNNSQLAGVEDVFNGILVRGDSTGDVVFYGKGAGKLPTASAVVADIIECVKHFDTRKYLFWDDSDEQYIKDYNEYETSLYVRVSYNSTCTCDCINEIKKQLEVSKFIDLCHSEENEIAFITKKSKFKDINESLKNLGNSGIAVLSKIKMGDF